MTTYPGKAGAKNRRIDLLGARFSRLLGIDSNGREEAPGEDSEDMGLRKKLREFTMANHDAKILVQMRKQQEAEAQQRRSE